MAQASADVLMTFAATGQDQVTGAMNKVQSHYEKTSKSVNKTSKSMENQFRLIRGGLGQMGHQVQDIAVQLQMGQNALLVFGQQGSQIASLMGPNGAIIGAFLAVGAALGTTFLPALFESGKAAEELGDKIEKVATKTKTLTKAQLEFLAVQYAKKIQEQKEQIDSATDSISGFSRQAMLAQKEMQYVDEGSAAFVTAKNRVQEMDENTKKATAEIELLNSEMEDNAKKLETIKAGGNPFFDTEKGAKEANKELTDLYRKVTAIQESLMQPKTEFDALGAGVIKDLATLEMALEAGAISQEQYNQTEIARLEKYADDVVKLNEKRFKNIQRLTEDNEKQIAAIQEQAEQERLDKQMANFEYEQVLIENNLQRAKDKAKELTDAYKLEQKRRQEISMAEQNVQAMALSSLQSTVGMAASLFKEGTAAQKAAYLAQQALAIATTIINTETASAAALAPPPIGLGPVAGLPYSNVIRAAGYASAAMIAGQTLASFEGGGFTGFGARAGGMDGKGGRLAMLHPNETVIDHTKQKSSKSEPVPVNVNFTIQANDTRGFDRLLSERRGAIVSLINQALNDRGRSSLGRV
jgi:hypothetical protein